MGDDLPSLIVGALALLFGGGVLGNIAQARASRKVGVRNADVQEGRNVVESSADLIDRLETRLDKVEARLTTVEEELSTERTLKWLLVRYAQTLLDYLGRRLETHEAPGPPDPIRHYFPQHFPSGKDAPHE